MLVFKWPMFVKSIGFFLATKYHQNFVVLKKTKSPNYVLLCCLVKCSIYTA